MSAAKWGPEELVYRSGTVVLVGLIALAAVPAGAQQQPNATPSHTTTTVSPSDQLDPEQQQFQERVVVTGSVAPAPLGNLGRRLAVISADDVEALPFDAVGDVLRVLSSVDVRARGPFGVQNDFALRGANYGQTLVMVDGARLNDAQAGHHNGDVPVPLAAIDRIEVLPGGGSSLHGADAFGGTINIITRRSITGWRADLSGGSFGSLDASASGGLAKGAIAHTFAASFSRSSGFMADRDHKVFTGSYRMAAGDRTSLLLGYADKAFGANRYYGPAPSREWTTQTLVNLEQRVLRRDRWSATVDAFYRTHSDHFIYDETQPSLSENRHRTHAIGADLKVRFTASEKTEVSVGAAGGGDWVRSTNLGDHDFGRGSLFAELQQRLGDRVIVSPGVRFDGYNTFGSSWSPSLAVSAWSSPRVKWRAAAGHSFRVPTFTELYYHDPNNQGSADLKPEHAWTTDVGADLFLARGWSAAGTVFGRWEDNVIDWMRSSPTDRWVSTNVRDVRSHGIEGALHRSLGSHGMAMVQYTWQRLSADSLGVLSKYVLDYSTRSLAVAGAAHAGLWSVGPRLEYKHRIDGRAYWVLDARVGRRLGDWEIFLDAANLLDQQYQEITGVAMPGRWAKLGIRRR
jgi:iron complex outermembrane receptor protein